MYLGVHSCMLENAFALPAAIAQAARLGYDAYEIDFGISDLSWKNRKEAWSRVKENVIQAAKANTVVLPSICLGVLWQHSLASDDATDMTTGIGIVRDAIDIASELGATAMLIPIGHPADLDTGRAKLNVIESIQACVDKAAQNGITLALENVCQRVLLTAQDLIDVVDQVASEFCGAYYDPGNQTFIGIDPVDEIRQLGNRIARVHLKDTIDQPRNTGNKPKANIQGDFGIWWERTTVTVGEGELPYGEIVRALEDVGYDAPLIIEVPQSPETAESGSLANLLATRKIFGLDNKEDAM